MNAPVILFIPVSSVSGIGEYSRSLIIANALHKKWPQANIHFILNNAVPYYQQCPFTVHPCHESATKDTLAVNKVIKTLKPDLVIFDASGRAEQFKQAKSVGAKVAFISQHAKKRSRGLKLNRLFLVDQHWVVQPDFCIAPLSVFQRLKLWLFNQAAPKNIGAVFSEPSMEQTAKVLTKFGLSPQDFFIFNAGSGGHKTIIQSEEQLSADIYYQAAQRFFNETHLPTLMVFGDNYPNNLPNNIFVGGEVQENTCAESTTLTNHQTQLRCIKSLTNDEFIVLLTQAQGRVISAGDTLLQCLALQKSCVAAAVSKDQPKRLTACADNTLVYQAKLAVESLFEQAMNLLKHKTQLTHSLSESGLHSPTNSSAENGLTTILNDIELHLRDKIKIP